MFASFLITFREVLEAALIVATIAGILNKINAREKLSTVWRAVAAAAGASVLLVLGTSIVGFEFHKMYTGRTEQIIEGVLMFLTAGCITWAVFVLNKKFTTHKLILHQQIDTAVKRADERGLFILVFVCVFREGFEIVLFLSALAISTSPQLVSMGFVYGAVVGLWFAYGIFRSSIKMPIYMTFRVTNMLLIFFAAGLLARGVHELAEAEIFPEIAKQTFSFLPPATTFMGGFLKSMFGITQQMDVLQMAVYVSYVLCMVWYVRGKNKKNEILNHTTS